MFKKIKEFFTGKPAEIAPVTAPYMAPEPAATTPIPFVPAGTEASVVASAPVVEEVKVEALVVVAPVVDAVVEVALVVETVVETAPAKKPRKPRTPKAVSAEEPAVKIAAPKKAAAIKVSPKI